MEQSAVTAFPVPMGGLDLPAILSHGQNPNMKLIQGGSELAEWHEESSGVPVAPFMGPFTGRMVGRLGTLPAL